ncbi:DnaJ homolog subfamily C member 2 (Gliosarcoma-related antigen MIDA1) (Zuotin-related factor 1) [Durusdinium trenchii]|uniref:DnaJ homolog subfamily C member 2 (Gliosarcoma-related antigen MIDA1) (Zuotin-related factor 1) n=1 Tax=Durusdinium trenchii TaxID=1381693 RepID=A0ABP0JJN8_9DINO
MLALPAPGDTDQDSQVLCGICLRSRRLEPAGHAFHAVHEKPLLKGRRSPTVQKEKEESEDDTPSDAWRNKKKKDGTGRSALKLSALLTGEDLYKLLEVSETSSVEQIKKQYRKLALQHHPDKQGGDAGEEKASGLSEKDQHFIKIQEAYEVLSDQSKRRQYDSTLDFDDSVPDEVDEQLGFYETFAPVFRKNARWSTRFPVPELGDEKTEMTKVHKFYDFWLSFDSWRDFSMHDEYNLEDAEFREERRWMERQNQRVRKKYVEAERRRIMRLAETAEKWDPRIRAEREERENKKREEKERRARAKQEEIEEKQRKEEEKRRRLEEEQAAEAEKERLQREQRKQDKQAAKTLRQRFKKSVQAQCKFEALEMEELQDFCLPLDAERLQELCESLEAKQPGDDSEAFVRQELSEAKRRRAEEHERQERQRQEARKREQKASESKESVPWKTEELGLLAKGLQKFPGGMGGRWALITKFLNDSGYERTEKEVVEKTKELSEGQSLRSMGSKIAQEGPSFQDATRYMSRLQLRNLKR